MIRERIEISDLDSKFESIKKMLSNYETLKEMMNNEEKYDELDLRGQLRELKYDAVMSQDDLKELIEDIYEINKVNDVE